MTSSWQSILRTNFTSVDELAAYLQLGEEDRAQLLAKSPFTLNVPERLAAKMAKGTLDDPLARQFFAHTLETKQGEGFLDDPNAESLYTLTGKMLKKYAGRALIVTTSACAMHCRYCFRQNYPYEKEKADFEEELSGLRSDTSLFEVILSGGDPLSLPDRRLMTLLEGIDAIPHIQLIRFHTRFPIGIPERIDDAFLDLFASINKQIVFVVHVNHARELDSDVLFSLKRIQKLGIPVLSQSVLLKDVNDTVEALEELMLKLSANGIIPYYLHQLDRVRGSQRFEVGDERAIALIGQIRERLPGYAVPQLVREIPGHLHKTPLLVPRTLRES
ncbi:KamA family radical SAM protein [Estrella lausannensis]|uniref:L-lysine 2,3-aminomutase n=1 Tax=Estrella lausannensis TaxID=483423 RepID=A0A0H5DQZ5_9BACT|nr:KamA family radical SAM protein [Estrella lausannensis]CRX38997.1 Putative lysine 2,3-aminomutase [Estrella lausannensis]